MTEMTRRALTLAAIELAVTVVPLAVAYLAARPDARAALTMRAAWLAKRAAGAQARMWTHLELRAATAYNMARNTVL